MKKVLSLLLTATIVFSIMASSGFNVKATVHEELPQNVETVDFVHLTAAPEGYIGIYTKADLNAVRNNLNGSYILMNDITFSEEDFSEDGKFYNTGSGWSPIGNNESPFTGIFDGNGYSVNGYQIYEVPSSGNIGLFGYITGGVRNLLVSGIIDISVSSSTVYVGGVCGYLRGTIENCQSNVSVYSTETVSSSTYESSTIYCGGIAGYSVGSVDCCTNLGTINVAPNPIDYSELYGYVGGIVGYNDKGSLINSENKGNIEIYDNARTGTEKVSTYYAGGVSGCSTGNITLCKNSGALLTKNALKTVNYAYRYLAGISALSSGEISECSNTGSIDCIGLYCYASGIVSNNTGPVINCNNHGRILGTSQSDGSSTYKKTYVAGISSFSSGAIEMCYNTGKILWNQIGASEAVYTGGISGYTTGDISNCYNVGFVQGGMYYGCSGGIVGFTNGNISACYDIACVGSSSAIAGSTSKIMNNCFYSNYAMRGTKGKDVAVACSIGELQKQSTYVGFDFVGTWTMGTNSAFPYPVLVTNQHIITPADINSDFSGGSGTILDPYIIKTTDQLNSIRDYPYSNFVLGNDIVFDGTYNWTPINYFKGSLNGNGFNIVNLKIHVDASASQNSLDVVSFMRSMDGYIFNLGIKNADIRSNGKQVYIGGFAGFSFGKIENCYFSGEIYCLHEATSGGIAENATGGIAASVAGPIKNCYNIGYIYNGYVYSKTGGIAGYVSGGSGDAGSWDGLIESCYNSGAIIGGTAGGIAGTSDDSTISNCYNTGTINGSRNTGGILGHNHEGTYILSSYNCGTLTGTNAHAILGSSFYATGYAENCYYLNNISSGSSDDSITAKSVTASELSTKSTFRGFDFKTVWTMDGNEGYTYPELRNCGTIKNTEKISGTIKSFGSGTNTVTIELIPEGTTEATYTSTATGNNAEYLIPDVYSGVYTLKVSKANHIVYEAVITVDDEPIIKDVSLELGNNGKPFKINSANLVLSQNINVMYHATVPDGFANPYMVFSFNGKTTTVTKYTVDDSGRYSYVFPGVNPQKIGDNICATLYATVSGIEVNVSVPTYSVRQYCINQLNKTTDLSFKSLLSDLLVYGEKAQIYQTYKTDSLVTDGLTLTPSTYVSLDSSYNKQQLIGTTDPNVKYSSANLLLSNEISIQLGITTNDPSHYTFEVSINDRTDVFTLEDLEYRNGKYFLTFYGIKPSAFDDEITAVIKKDGLQIGQTLKYSVHTYIQKNQDTENEVFKELLHAIYNYGNSARKYTN